MHEAVALGHIALECKIPFFLKTTRFSLRIFVKLKKSRYFLGNNALAKQTSQFYGVNNTISETQKTEIAIFSGK